MVRAPCCDKMGLKKGPWTAEEDQVLTSFIQQNGHGNWRQLPKLAGLLRCGKSCRLRWTNYLRPDIKRGNFSKEEEETIIQLHEMLGNRWSAIASKLPGRTDNEIKNVWHTHLKKKLTSHQDSKKLSSEIKNDPIPSDNPSFDSPQGSASELSTVTDSSVMKMAIKREEMDSFESKFPEIDDSFWSEELAAEDSGMKCFEFPGIDEELQVLMLSSGRDDGMDFWYNIFTRAGELPVLPEF